MTPFKRQKLSLRASPVRWVQFILFYLRRVNITLISYLILLLYSEFTICYSDSSQQLHAKHFNACQTLAQRAFVQSVSIQSRLASTDRLHTHSLFPFHCPVSHWRSLQSPREQIILAPSLARVDMAMTQLTQENADFATRNRYHHSSFMSREQLMPLY
jgi:hypothetical protein